MDHLSTIRFRSLCCTNPRLPTIDWHGKDVYGGLETRPGDSKIARGGIGRGLGDPFLAKSVKKR